MNRQTQQTVERRRIGRKFLTVLDCLFDDPALINTILPRYLAVTGEQIRQAAAEVFRADNRIVMTYIPKAADATTGEEAAA